MIDVTRRTALLSLGALAGAGLAGRAALAQSKSLVVPTLGGVWEQFWRKSVGPAFAKATGADVKFDVGNGRIWSANLRAAGVAKPPYSIVMCNEVFASSLRKEGFFEKLDLAKVPNYADLYPLATKTGGYGAICAVSPIGLGYRTDLVKTPPKSWKDLWNNPEFKGRIGLYNYANSAGKMTVLMASRIFGKDQYDADAGFAALAKLGRVIQTDFNMSTALSSGEIVVAPFDFGEIANLRRKGLPVDCIVPEEGMIMFDQTLNILANGADKDLAYQYANFMLSPDMQAQLAREFFVSPTNAKVAIPDDLKKDVPISGADMDKILVWDWDFVNANAAAFAERWAKTFS